MQFFANTSSSLWDGAIDVVATAKAADKCNRILGQELPKEEELAAKTRELDARAQFKVYNPLEPGKRTKEVVGTRWVLTWKMVEGVKTVRARLLKKKASRAPI